MTATCADVDGGLPGTAGFDCSAYGSSLDASPGDIPCAAIGCSELECCTRPTCANVHGALWPEVVDALPTTESEGRALAQLLGLMLGGGGLPFAGDYDTKGLHVYADDAPSYRRRAFWGTGGTVAQMQAPVGPHSHQYRPWPHTFDCSSHANNVDVAAREITCSAYGCSATECCTALVPPGNCLDGRQGVDYIEHTAARCQVDVAWEQVSSWNPQSGPHSSPQACRDACTSESDCGCWSWRQRDSSHPHYNNCFLYKAKANAAPADWFADSASDFWSGVKEQGARHCPSPTYRLTDCALCLCQE